MEIRNRLIISLLVLQILTSCTHKNASIHENGPTISKSEEIVPRAELEQKTNGEIVSSKIKILKIDPKCIGCGKCVRIDSEHFIFNQSTWKAEVNNQRNLNSPGLEESIRICPVDAIEIS